LLIINNPFVLDIRFSLQKIGIAALLPAKLNEKCVATIF